MGPNLNVIVGPNGSGKSTIVNGICLGLAGKTSVLGRATNMSDFIRVGAEQAQIEVELFIPEKENVVVGRRWQHDNKTHWTIDGRKATGKEVEKLVEQYRIQVDNLCQFLPQDKVHDFSRLDSKGLLNSTVDAVGDSTLKEKHQELKELQNLLNEGDDLFERKKQMLNEKTVQCQRLEEEVKAFEDKKKIEDKIQLLQGRLLWSKLDEVKKETRAKKEVKEIAARKLEKEESRLDPLKDALKEAKQRKQKMEVKLTKGNDRIKENRIKAQTHSKNIEKLEEKVNAVSDELEEINRREQENEEEIRKLKITIAELEAEYKGNDQEVSVGPQEVEQARKAAHLKQRQVEDIVGERDNLNHSLTELKKSMSWIQKDLDELRNVDKQKLQILKSSNQDAFKACMWLRDHLDQFQGQVFEPFIVCANMINPANAVFVESSIGQRDMTAFFFSEATDMNKFLNIMRQEKGWKMVSAVQFPPTTAASFVPEIPASDLHQYGFISYVREMVSAPDGVLAFMCRNYSLHRVAVFQTQAEKYNDMFVDDFGLTKFYFGTKCQTVSGSRYSKAKTTMTRYCFNLKLICKENRL